MVKSQLELEQETAELREQFIAILGHDLRNPLASIAAAARMLRKEEQTDRATKILDLMQGSVIRMSGLMRPDRSAGLQSSGKCPDPWNAG